jgi:hypothetical protein
MKKAIYKSMTSSKQTCFASPEPFASKPFMFCRVKKNPAAIPAHNPEDPLKPHALRRSKKNAPQCFYCGRTRP